MQKKFEYKGWSNRAKVIYKRTYARKDEKLEDWNDTVKRVIAGNCKDVEVSKKEQNELEKAMLSRKGSPAGRGIWYSGTKSHYDIGGVANNNCWFLTGDDWTNIVVGMDLLMLGGGVGMSVEHKYVSKLHTVKKNVSIVHKKSNDAHFIVPDCREGWCQLIHKLLKSYFVTGKSFEYSTVLVRGYGEKISGFGGTSSGPAPLISCVEKISAILNRLEGKKLKPLDLADIICAVGEMVVAGNVRRSAIMIMGDCWDKKFLRAKRWDLDQLPTQRAMANYSVVCDDYDDLHPSFWKSYEMGEPIGIINRKNMQKYGRMGEIRRDKCVGVNPCAEATLENGEPCNLVEIGLANIKTVDEFEKIARLMFRYAKRVTLDKYHHPLSDKVIKKNRRVGVGITGCLQAPHLFNPEALDRVYKAIQDEDEKYSEELGVPLSVKTTVIKPSGTIGKMFDMSEGIHGGFSRHIINTIRFSSSSELIPLLKGAGHKIEPLIKFDGSLDHGTSVVDFYVKTPDSVPVSDENWDTWKQLEAVKMAQKYWADQSISVTVYYKKEEIPQLKEWVKNNLSEIKTISFLCHSDHGFVQAPLQAITKEEYEKGIAKIKPIDISSLTKVEDIEGEDCEGGLCPIK